MRITLDTGILVRTNTKATGPARQLLEIILVGPHELVVSEFLLIETARVLQYPRMQDLYKLTSDKCQLSACDLAGYVDAIDLNGCVSGRFRWSRAIKQSYNDGHKIWTSR